MFASNSHNQAETQLQYTYLFLYCLFQLNMSFNHIRQEELPSSDMIVFKEGDNIGVSKLLTFYRKEPFYIQAEYADPLVVPCANPIIGKNQMYWA